VNVNENVSFTELRTFMLLLFIRFVCF